MGAWAPLVTRTPLLTGGSVWLGARGFRLPLSRVAWPCDLRPGDWWPRDRRGDRRDTKVSWRGPDPPESLEDSQMPTETKGSLLGP